MISPWLTFYGDDFTGSTDVLEVLQWSGVPTMLFLSPPSAELLNRFRGLQAWGIAGRTRSMSPADMELELRPALASLCQFKPRIVHYKTCSTFDSSPEVGSIGRALEVGQSMIGSRPVPVVVGAPQLGRYQAFGNLFARSGLDTEPFRLDRHPTMRCHPITPMDEADLRLHLARQTDARVALCDVISLEQNAAQSSATWLGRPDFAGADAVLFDVLNNDHLATIGRSIWELSESQSPCYAVGSSGIEYALIQWLSRNTKDDGVVDFVPGRIVAGRSNAPFPAVGQLLAITGSCSPVNARQIEQAEQHGFITLPLDPVRLIDPQRVDDEVIRTADQALKRIEAGANLILHTSLGPQDPRIAAVTSYLKSQGLDEIAIRRRTGELLGIPLGRLLARILARWPFQRIGVAGGDTSGYIARTLGLLALEAIAPVAPGSPLCRAHADGPLQGVEFFFKGGQVGKDNVWQTMLCGTEDRSK
ncbi:MAG: four-carbon acid sugar kinase family protein [Pirellulales bacterium]